VSGLTQAIVLAAGAGTRLAPATQHTPKPLLPFLNRPLLEHVLRRLASAGVAQVWLNAHHHAGQLVAFAQQDPVPGLQVEVVVEPLLLGTGGGIRNLAPRLEPGPLLVLAGDILADFDLEALLARHRGVGGVATMALTPRADPARYGAVEIDARGRLTDVAGLLGRPGERALVNASAHLLEPGFIELLPRGPGCLVRQGYVRALEAGLSVAGWVHPGRWHETGTVESLLAAQYDALRGRAPVDAELLLAGGRLLPGPALVHPTARVAADASLGPGTTVAAGASVGAGAQLERCLVLPGADVPAGARLSQALVCPTAQPEQQPTSTDAQALAGH